MTGSMEKRKLLCLTCLCLVFLCPFRVKAEETQTDTATVWSEESTDTETGSDHESWSDVDETEETMTGETAPESEVVSEPAAETVETEFQEPAALSLEAGSPESGENLEAFVRRCYEEILQRKADPKGLADWVDLLENGQATGADIGLGFLESDEFKSRNLDDASYIDVLYQAFLDREADEYSAVAEPPNLLE